MARIAGDAAIQTKEARSRKKIGRRYWRGISDGVAIGYRRGKHGGTWNARIRGADGKHKYRVLGEADDIAQANGVDILDFGQAQDKALAEAKRGKREQGIVRTPVTVSEAVERYVMKQRAKKGNTAAEDAKLRLNKHAVPKLGRRRVADLSLTQLQAWRDDLVSREVAPVSRATANRIIANLKAALNAAFKDDKNDIPTDKAWRALESFDDTANARPDHFEVEQVQRLIDAARKFDPLFADLLTAGFLTGARYSELTACDVRHFDRKRGLLLIPSGKTGARPVTLILDAIAFFESITSERDGTEPLFLKADGSRWAKSEQHRRMKKALNDKDVKLPKTTVFYSLRHSHISRAIEEDVPLFIIARNCGTSEPMIRRHYAKLLAVKERAMLERAAKAFRLRVVPDMRQDDAKLSGAAC
jgi:integrase